MSTKTKRSTSEESTSSHIQSPLAVNKSKFSNFFEPLMGIVVAIVIIAAMNHQYLYAQLMMWLTPASATSNHIVVSDDSIGVSLDPKVIIPKLNIDAPVVYGMNRTDESSIQKSLEGGVLHFAGTPNPGEGGNAVFVGHSSNDVWAPGNYKFVFALLDHLEIGDEYALHYDGIQYVFRVREKKVVSPSDVSVVANSTSAMSTLITCTPTGTNFMRLVVRGEQISPAPVARNQERATNPSIAQLPGN